MTMRSRYLHCLGREIHFTEWGAEGGDGAAPPVIAWHGLARSSRDFDDFAAALSARWRVICPDTPGRGLSQWAQDPAREYCLDFYVDIAEALLDQLGLLDAEPEAVELVLTLDNEDMRELERIRAARDIGSVGAHDPDLPSLEAQFGGGKVGRNAPCPCGSGKKFKRCHGG